jgi:uncharacterized protein (TIGR01777 family)
MHDAEDECRGVVKTVVTGATGFVGLPLVAKLRERGDEVVALVRDVARAKQRLRDVECVQADFRTPGSWAAVLEGADGVVHLAGEPISAVRLDANRKREVRDSRVETMRAIVTAMRQCKSKPRVLVTASGVDYYALAADHADTSVTEAAPAAANTFLGHLCQEWEHAACDAESLGVRVVCMRAGLVVGQGSKVLKLRRVGSGRQWVSWIHLDDLVAAYAAALTDERYRGPINVVAGSVRNVDFARLLGKTMPVPAFIVKLALGEVAMYRLGGRNVVPAKLRELGFAWTRTTLASAIAQSKG